MSWKQRGISICRRVLSGHLFENLRPKYLSAVQKCEMKTQQQSIDCCQPKSLMDEATVPEGSWSEHYKRKNEENTKVLAIGVLSFLVTMAVVQKKGLVKGHPEISLLF